MQKSTMLPQKTTFGGKVNAISPMVEKFDAKQTVGSRYPGPVPPPKPLPNLAALAVVTSSLAFGSFRIYINLDNLKTSKPNEMS